MTSFELDPRLAADTVPVGDLALCRVLLMNDARFPWIILVPRRPGLTELHQLEPEDGRQLWREIRTAGTLLAQFGTKINTGALGNLVPQLHIHVVARTAGDPAWPGPVWGSGPRRPYPPDAVARWTARLSEGLGTLEKNCTHTE